MFAALLALGHAFPSADLYTYLPGTGVAVPTVVAFAALALGLLLACRDAGIAGALTSRNAAAGAGLRLLLSSLAAVALLTTGVLTAQRHEIFDTQPAVLLLAWCALGRRDLKAALTQAG